MLGICYGMQLMAHQLGGKVDASHQREYGPAMLEIDEPCTLFDDLPSSMAVWMSHGDRISEPPPGFRQPRALLEFAARRRFPTAATASAFSSTQRWCTRRRAPRCCATSCSTSAAARAAGRRESILELAIEDVRKQIGDGKAICALSGGVDSAVAAAMTYAAIGDRLTCVFVNNGVMRQGEPEQVQETFRKHLGIKLHFVDASQRFLGQLAGVTDPETKRKRIGETFIRVFEETAAEFGHIDVMVQGTTYPDVIESGQTASKGSRCQSDQVTPQRWWPAGRHGAAASSSRCATCSRTRCAK